MFMGPAEITGQAALVEYNLGAYGAAVERDEVALGMLSEGFARNGFAAQVSLARNRLAAGDADAAITAGHRALDVMGGDGVNSPRWGRHLARFVHDAQQGAPAGAAQFAERYREVAAP
jgi:hypothetical protein